MFLMYTLHNSSTSIPLISMQMRRMCTNNLLPGACDFQSLEATALGLRGRAQEECSLAWHRLEFLESGARGGHTQKRNTSQPAPAAPRRATTVLAGSFHDSMLAGARTLQKGAGPKRGCHPAASTQVAPERTVWEPASSAWHVGASRTSWGRALPPGLSHGALPSPVMMGKTAAENNRHLANRHRQE